MGSLDTAPIPPHAITMWLTDTDIIAVLPMTAGGIPYLMKLPLSEGGLMQALELLRKRKHEVLAPTEAAALYAPPAAQPMVRTSKAQERLYAETTEAQRESARKLLAKMGIK